LQNVDSCYLKPNTQPLSVHFFHKKEKRKQKQKEKSKKKKALEMDGGKERKLI
jgi:hypothetical protein